MTNVYLWEYDSLANDSPVLMSVLLQKKKKQKPKISSKVKKLLIFWKQQLSNISQKFHLSVTSLSSVHIAGSAWLLY